MRPAPEPKVGLGRFSTPRHRRDVVELKMAACPALVSAIADEGATSLVALLDRTPYLGWDGALRFGGPRVGARPVGCGEFLLVLLLELSINDFTVSL